MTPRRLRQHYEALVAFHNVYGTYLEATLGNQQADHAEIDRLRNEVTRLMPAAQAALNVAGVNPVMYPPPAFGGPVLQGLGNVAFAHERPGFRMGNPEMPQNVL